MSSARTGCRQTRAAAASALSCVSRTRRTNPRWAKVMVPMRFGFQFNIDSTDAAEVMRLNGPAVRPRPLATTHGHGPRDVLIRRSAPVGRTGCSAARRTWASSGEQRVCARAHDACGAAVGTGRGCACGRSTATSRDCRGRGCSAAATRRAGWAWLWPFHDLAPDDLH